MQVKSTTKSLHPGRWQPATWILLAVWLTASAFGNFPFGPMGVGGNETTIVHIGFPLWYTEHQYDPSTGFVLTTTDGKYLFANLFLGVAIQLSLILGLQSFQQFSMKTMLLVVSFLADHRRHRPAVLQFMPGMPLAPIVISSSQLNDLG